MKFSGVQKTSLNDFPGRIATVLFAPGCNLRCPFCHNWRIVLNPRPPFLHEAAVLQLLRERTRYVEAVVVTGGEPSIHKELPKFLMKVKKIGLTIKLDTNGFFPNVLRDCIPYVDYVAVDVKTSLSKYERLGAKNTEDLLRTLEILKGSDVEYEFRATVVPGFVDEGDIDKIGEIVKGGMRFVFQKFVPGDTLDKTFNTVESYADDVISHFAEIMKPYVEEVLLRV